MTSPKFLWLSVTMVVGCALAAVPLYGGTNDRVRGPRLFLQCQACHSIKPGDPHKIGPNLAGIVNAPAASRPGYNYSEALRRTSLRWDAVTLDRWLTNPTRTVPGTKMIYPGMRVPEDRAVLIEYLRRPGR